MADAQENAGSAQEPSMEEILASIRKIITDENSGAPAAPQDVIELTQMVQDDGSVLELKPAAMAAPAPEPEPLPPALPPTSAIVPPPPPSTPTPTPEPKMNKPADISTPPVLTSEPASIAAASSLSSLANTIEIERLATAPISSTPLGNGARTLEDMVIELMRPLLKQWLDQNLPATVDRLVQKEIERISRRVQD